MEKQKKLIEIIKKSNLIVIYGVIGSGKNLLLTKLSQHPELKGNVHIGGFTLADLPTKGNVYISDLGLVQFASPNPYPSENKKQIQNWQELLSVAKNNQQRIFLSVEVLYDLNEETRNLADLIIHTQYVSNCACNEKHLSFLVKEKNQQWEGKINISTSDWTNLAEKYEYIKNYDRKQ